MDLSGLLSPKANAFSIAHLMDASQLPEFMSIGNHQTMFNWDSFRLTKDMEGEWTFQHLARGQRIQHLLNFLLVLFLFTIERLRNAGTGKKVHKSPEVSLTDATRSTHVSRRNNERCTSSSPPSANSLTCTQLMNVKVDIEMKNLWDDFHTLGTEMIVTKAGR